MTLTVTVPPSAEPVLLPTLKAHLRVDHPDEDALIGTYIAAARTRVEAFTRRRLITQDVTWRRDGFCAGLRLPVAPVQSVLSITYLSSAGSTETMDSADYRLAAAAQPAVIVPAYGKVWPVTQPVADAVGVSLRVGYGASGADVPADLVMAVFLLAAHYYAYREPVMSGAAAAELPESVSALLVPHVLWV